MGEGGNGRNGEIGYVGAPLCGTETLTESSGRLCGCAVLQNMHNMQNWQNKKQFCNYTVMRIYFCLQPSAFSLEIGGRQRAAGRECYAIMRLCNYAI